MLGLPTYGTEKGSSFMVLEDYQVKKTKHAGHKLLTNANVEQFDGALDFIIKSNE